MSTDQVYGRKPIGANTYFHGEKNIEETKKQKYMPSGKQDSDFAQYMNDEETIKVEVIVNKSALDTAIWWIAKELSPEDVFHEKDLEKWAESNGYVKE